MAPGFGKTAIGLLALAVLALAPGAEAARMHQFDAAFGTGGCSARDLALDAEENVYVVCGGQIRKFDADGDPVTFTASEPYVSGNAILYNPDPTATHQNTGDKSFVGMLDVDPSSGPTAGYIYAVAANEVNGDIDIFDTTGRWIGKIQSRGGSRKRGVGVDRDGNVYVSYENNGTDGWVDKHDSALQLLGSIPGAGGQHVAPDSTGAVWIQSGTSPGQQLDLGPLRKFEGDLEPPDPTPFDIELGPPSPFVENPLLSSVGSVDVDLATDEVYVYQGTASPGILSFSPGTAADPSHQIAPAFGDATQLSATATQGALGLDIDEDTKAVYATNDDEISRFVLGPIVPDVTTDPTPLAAIGHTEVDVTGRVDLDGGPDVTSCGVEYVTAAAYAATGFDNLGSGGSEPCSPAIPPDYSAATDVGATLSGLTPETEYRYRFKAANANGTGVGATRAVRPAAVIALSTDPASAIDTGGATLNGSFDPDGEDTTYRFEYGPDAEYGQVTPPAVRPGAPAGVAQVGAPVTGLQEGRVYHYRLLAENGLGETRGPDMTFRVASPPEIGGVRATNLSETGADLNATIDPVGYDTTYRFEYGATTAYGTSAPVPEADLAGAAGPQPVSIGVDDLQPGVTYHFRVLATNQWGTSTSADTTFSFFPPACPNEQVRQLTGGGYLPDCRAYELVSPARAGAVQLFPSDETWEWGRNAGGNELSYRQWPQNTGLASNPARFMFYGGLGLIEGIDAPNAILDAYVATRTPQGWVTTLPGLNGSEAVWTGRRTCTPALDLCLDQLAEEMTLGGKLPAPAEDAPFLFDVDGNKLGRLPTNVEEVADGEYFGGDQRPSPDFTHYAFSSKKAFAPGGLTGAPGSAYDNDLETEAVSIVSELPNGGDIPSSGGGANETIRFPGISEDGSHILMQTATATTAGAPVRLYMRVDDAASYDVTGGAAARFVGMTGDGSKVVFTTAASLELADTDAGADLYMWEEGTDDHTLLSVGNGQGNGSACGASWTTGCGVLPLETERGKARDAGHVSAYVLDDPIASGSGDAYFYSPESLDEDRPGVPGERNLYVHRDGEARLVATLDPGTEVERMQISPDGGHAAFITAARLTGYDNDGFRQMYVYDASERVLRCASCKPSGEPPVADVEGSQGGPFMSDDGRAFFATRDSLVPQDTNGAIRDVYEYVGGRPQLISSGTGFEDMSSGGNYTYISVPLGLEAVSADGLDVYFTTYDSLVPQDRNGPFVKFYNARTGGGFMPERLQVPCEAADECHGGGSPAPAAPLIGTGAALGEGGNLRPRHRPRKSCVARKAKRKSRAARKARRKRRAARAAKRKNRAPRKCRRRGGR